MAPVEHLADRLEAPELDDRSYRVIRLPNKLEALLVHDPDTDKASASVNVNVGSFSDADNMPGMAHAVEHLLFMGTKKYPVENAYSQYLTAHSGYSNAYTASTETNYFFEVAASAEADSNSTTNGSTESPLHGALDRFAQFFISPLFLAETLDRELRAVDSENKKNLQSDNWRLSQLDKSLSNPKHPYHHFSTGNLQTLLEEPRKRGVEIRKEFIDFHAKHYSANRMKLVILGKEPLDELESWVVDLFSDVRNKELPPNTWPGLQPYTKDDVLMQIYAKPVMDTRSLDLSFTYRNEEHLYETHPSRYLSHLIGHEGPGSILAYIKAKGWANGLSAGAMDVCPDTALFHISIRLTPEGLKEYRKVTEVVFQYISMIKEAGPQRWIVDELKDMSAVDFRFKQKSPASKFTSKLSSVMQKPLPREWLLSGDRLIRRFESKQISEALEWLRADNYRITIVSQEYPGDWDQKEKWYGTEYRMARLPEDFQAMAREAITSTSEQRPSELYLPNKNEFIPTRLSVEKKEVSEPLKAPILIRNEVGLRTWWKKDDRFWVPKGTLMLALRNPLVAVTVANAVKAKLFCQLVKDALNEYSYDAEIAGLDFQLESDSLGISVDVSGYNDKMPVLLEKVLVSMRDLEVKPDRFQIVKERLLRGFRNWNYQQPFHQVGEYTRWLNNPSGWINEEYLAEVPHMTPQDITSFIPQLLGQIHIEILAHGNLYKEDALRMTTLIQNTLKPRALPAAQWGVTRNLILPQGSDFTYRRVLSDPANINNCIEYYLHVGSQADPNLRAKVLLLAQLGDEQGFDQLRTKEQLGYIVFTGSRIATSTVGFRVIVQSERTPEYLEERINAFLDIFGKTLEDMPQQEFDGHKRSLINKRLEKLKNLNQEGTRFWTHISSDYFNFLQAETDVAELRPITKNEMIEFFKHHIHPTSPHRAKISIHLKAQSSPSELAGSMTPADQKEKLVDVVSKFLTAAGVGVDPEALATRFEKLDISNVNESAVVDTISQYLVQDAKAAKEQTDFVVEQGKQLLGTVLPSLGIELRPNAKEAEELHPAPKVKPTTYVEDVEKFRASLEMSAAPRPVVDLSEYEEVEPKL